MMGTSIQELNKGKNEYFDNLRNLQTMGQANYGVGQNIHHEQGHNAAHNMHQAQQNQYYNMQNTGDYPQFIQPDQQNPGYLTKKSGQQSQQQAKEVVDIEELAKEINENLTEDTFASVAEGEEEKSAGSSILSSLPSILREPLIILVLFIILSQPMVKDTMGKYIPQINPCEDGQVSFTGVVIYGVLFAVLFALVKKFLL